MKANLKALGTTLFLGTVITAPAMASEDSKYPAYDFKPSVIYSDAALVGKSSVAAPAAQTHAPDPKYPAAHFEPTVIHAATPSEPAVVAHVADPKYPAAYFTPSVIYQAK
ncbi:hypothetical protein [Methylomagnum sp.]